MYKIDNQLIDFSIIIPVYNSEKFIKKCIDSILEQNYKNYEIIVVNDGSTDKSKEIVKKYKINNLRLINQKNKGLSGARNAGLKCALGKYVIFIDADDYVEKNLLIELSKYIDKYDVVIYGYYNEIVRNEILVKQDRISFVNSNIKSNIRKMDIFAINSLIGFAWNKAYSRAYLFKNKFFFEEGTSLVEDIIFNESVLIKTDKIICIPIPLTHYVKRIDTVTLSQKKYDNLVELMIRSLKARINILKKYDNENNKNITELIEFMLIYLLNYSKGSLYDKYKCIKKFLFIFDNYFNKEFIKNPIIFYCIKYNLTYLLVLIYDMKNKIKSRCHV